MAAPCFITWNASTSDLTSPMAGTATSSTSGTAKTILQIKPGSNKIRVVEWGYIFTATPTAPVQIELIETGTVFATVSAGNVVNYNDTTGPASQATAGFNASAEGSITATRLLGQNFDLSTYFKQQFPLGREPEVQNGYSLRIRATPSGAASTTVLCYVVWEEEGNGPVWARFSNTDTGGSVHRPVVRCECNPRCDKLLV